MNLLKIPLLEGPMKVKNGGGRRRKKEEEKKIIGRERREQESKKEEKKEEMGEELSPNSLQSNPSFGFPNFPLT